MSKKNFCNRTRREFLWETGARFGATALTGMLAGEGFFSSARAASEFANPLSPKQTMLPALAKSVIFLFMSVDEMLELHERLIEPLRGALETSGAFYYAWVIPYGMAVGVIGAIYLKFLLHLPRRTAIGFIVSGAVFVTGAIGFEMLSGVIFEQNGSKDAYYVFVQTIEEMLEMVGIAMFIYAITDYIAGEFGSVTVSLNKTAPPA